MQYGDEIQVLEDGPIVNPKSLEPLGIGNGSTCWGLWVGGPSTRNRKRQMKSWQIPHLIVSAIHPDSWPISFYLRVLLRKNQGCLRRFLEIVDSCNADLHFSECTFAGYDHQVLNAYGRFSDLVDWKSQFLEFYQKKKNTKRLNEAWLNTHGRGNGDKELAGKKYKSLLGKPIFFESICKALTISSQGFQTTIADRGESHLQLPQQFLTNPYSEDSIRRHALEWLGRRMLGRLTGMWVKVRVEEYRLYHDAWNYEMAHADRPLPEDYQFDPKGKLDMDPEGDYFFTSKSVQTGRRPWNIELPFPPSWVEQEKDENERAKIVHKSYDKYPDILTELEQDLGEDGWFSNGEQTVKHLFESVKSTLDLIHSTRSLDNRPRATREAVLAMQHDNSNRWINAITERILRNNWVRPHMSRSVYDLAYASLWRRNEPPVEFRYDANRSQLIAAQANSLQNTLTKFWREQRTNQSSENTSNPQTPSEVPLAFPRIAVASFNTTERFLRLKFINREISDHQILSIAVDYKVKRTDNPQNNTRISKHSLLNYLCQIAEDNQLEIVRVATKLRSQYPEDTSKELVETGSIQMIARLPGVVEEGVYESLISQFNGCSSFNALSRHHSDEEFCRLLSANLVVDTQVVPWRTTEVFWSTVFGHSREKDLYEAARTAGMRYGLGLVRSDSQTRQTTNSVLNLIEGTDAMIQLICLRDADKLRATESETWLPDYAWLHTEYAMAFALKKPILRLIDDSMPIRIKKQFAHINRDVPIHAIDLRAGEDVLRQQLDLTMKQVRAGLGTLA